MTLERSPSDSRSYRRAGRLDPLAAAFLGGSKSGIEPAPSREGTGSSLSLSLSSDLRLRLAPARLAGLGQLHSLTGEEGRDRLAGGSVYPAERIDAALSNYFRLGNLTALRELALLWLADEVDQALQRYRAEQGIDASWEARERVVVTLTGGVEGETLLRRGARIATRSSGGELLAVHVTTQDGLRRGDPEALARQRALVEELGGTFHQVVGDDIPAALVDFAKAVNATQLVIGVSRRGRLQSALTGPGIGQSVIRAAGRIDVHVVNHAAAGGKLRLPQLGSALSTGRRVAGFALALTAGPLLAWLLAGAREEEQDLLTTDVLAFQLLVVIVALVGGLWPAVFAAVMSGLTLNFLFTDPIYTISIDEPVHAATIALYVIIAVLVSIVVDRAARQTRAARRAAAEAELLAMVAGSVLRGDDALQALVERAREAFGLESVALVDGGTVALRSGASTREPASIPVGDQATLQLHGRELAANERRLLGVIVAQLEAALERDDLAETASEVAPLAANDKVRTALLAAVSHDLRRPLAAAVAAVSGLRATGDMLADEDRDELLATAEESLEALTALLTDLLDVSRLQAGVLAISSTRVDPAAVVLAAVEELELSAAEVDLDLDAMDAAASTDVLADPVLLQRVLVNVLANARRHSPPDARVRIATSAFAGRVEVRIVDHGPGIPADRRDEVFVPFQRLGDTDNTTGLGLGLALSRGFVEGMGGTLEAEDTPGGGLTMVVTLHAADAAQEPA